MFVHLKFNFFVNLYKVAPLLIIATLYNQHLNGLHLTCKKIEACQGQATELISNILYIQHA